MNQTLHFFYLLILFFLFVPKTANTQNNCTQPQNKKLQKIYSDAIDFINKGIAQGSRTPEFFLNNAFPLMREVEKGEPDFAGAQYYLGILYTFRIEQRNLNTAKNYFIKSVELCPNEFFEAWFHLAKISFGKNNYELTLYYIDKYLQHKDRITDDALLVEAKLIKKEAEKIKDIFGNAVQFNPVVVEGISSENDEYLVIITPDHEFAFYTRQQPISDRTSAFQPELEYIEKFFISERLPNGDFDNGREMSFPFNRRYNEGGATLTIDNRELFYTVCEWTQCGDKGGRYYNCDIYHTVYEFGNWSSIQPIQGHVNQKCTWESQPSISTDGNTLYFISDREGGYGMHDIFTSGRQADGTWSSPKNLGKIINTAGRDASPFIHTDSKTLYFSSDGHIGIGGYDIFFSKQKDDGTWTKPKNIGYPINTQYDEIGFIVSTDGRYGYFSSDRIGLGPGGKDFYSFELYPEARPERVLFIKGEIKDHETETPIEAKVEIRNMDTKVVHKVKVNAETGKYVAALPFKNDYVLTVKKEDYVYESMYIAIDDTLFSTPATVNKEIQKIEVGKSYKINDIYFEHDSYMLNALSKQVIEEFTIFLNENSNLKVSINGHTDNVGGAEYNFQLSERRAKSVYNYLLILGISAERLSYEGMGFTRPVASNETEEGRALNRRTEFVILSK